MTSPTISPKKRRNSNPYVTFNGINKMPIIFEQTEEQLEYLKKKNQDHIDQVINQNKERGILASPDALIRGMHQFLKKIGLKSSYIEKQIDYDPDADTLWTIMFEGLLDPGS